ncbi:hypothetical protein DFQ28_008511 [Apophysomyces sp. BC1034]|nr:hypothetical protein DFQ30_009306 [Apophysomyces sp. BC1015]KAG0181834.1 hypothetical protein DFQ29_006945 [Apophysomyces sp. BC1021]KAG0192635.1 hypothetical protein DFQ28_008511 [Apophysomyces sp. BC1034]
MVSPRAKRPVIIAILLTLFITFPTYYYLIATTDSSEFTTHDSITKPTVFIAANLYNNEAILEEWTKQLNRIIDWLSPARVFISIYENGSTDRTKPMLQAYDTYLSESKVQHQIVAANEAKYQGRRIPALANIRNQALKPLHSTQMHFDKILFLNDIIFELSDAVSLLMARGGDYDAVCAMDFFGEFYDLFATREVNGGWVGSGNYPYFEDKGSRELLANGQLIPVYSCWNGMIAMNAEPFIKDLVAFRAILPDEPEVPREASECCLIHTDLREHNYTKIFINPQVKVAYDPFHYWYARYIIPLWNIFLAPFNNPASMTDDEKTKWDSQIKTLTEKHGIDVKDTICLWK